MTKKNRFFLILWGILALIVIMDIVLLNIKVTQKIDVIYIFAKTVAIVFVIYSILYAIVYIIERQMLDKKIKKLNRNTKGIINYCENRIQKNICFSTVRIARITLILALLNENQPSKAYNQFQFLKIKSQETYLFYPKIISEVLSQKIEEAKETLISFEKRKDKAYSSQIEYAKQLIEMGQTKIVNKELIQKTKYKCIKEYASKI